MRVVYSSASDLVLECNERERERERGDGLEDEGVVRVVMMLGVVWDIGI